MDRIEFKLHKIMINERSMDTIETRQKVRKMLWGIKYKTQKKQKEIAKELNIDPCTISGYINMTKTPTLQNFIKIQNYYENLLSTRTNTN